LGTTNISAVAVKQLTSAHANLTIAGIKWENEEKKEIQKIRWKRIWRRKKNPFVRNIREKI